MPLFGSSISNNSIQRVMETIALYHWTLNSTTNSTQSHHRLRSKLQKHSQFLRICKKHDTRIFPQVRVTSVEPCVQQKFPRVDPNQPQTAVLLPPACQPLESNMILAEASCKTSRNDVSHTSIVVFRPVSRGIKAEWKDREGPDITHHSREQDYNSSS